MNAVINLFALVVRWGLGLAFVYAGFSKSLDVPGFASVISDYGLVPELLLVPAALFMIAMELIAGLGLIVGYAWALHIVTAMLVLFIGVLAYGLWLGLDVDCGCFGPGDPEGDHHAGARSAIFRDLGMLLGVALLYFQHFYQKRRGGENEEA